MRRKVQYFNKEIVYEINGSGPVLVLLHGFLESKEIWDEFTVLLKNDFKVISIDLPGHGESDLVSESHSMQIMAGAVSEVLAVEKVTELVVAGHSMGGYVALQFGLDHSEMLKGLVLFHSHAAADTDEAKENRRRTIDIVRQNKGAYIRQFIPDLFDPNHVDEYSGYIEKLQAMAATMKPESVTATLSGMRDRESYLGFLKITKIPVFFIIGKQDKRMPFSQLLVQAETPLHSEILLLEDVGHMGYIEAPVKTLRALQHFALRCYE